jgi:hypothetical protein
LKSRGKKSALDLQPHVIKFTSCLPMVGGSLRLGTQDEDFDFDFDLIFGA